MDGGCWSMQVEGLGLGLVCTCPLAKVPDAARQAGDSLLP